MGVKARFYRGAWWVFVDHHGQRRSKKVGDHQTALRLAREIRERLVRADFHLPGARDGEVTFTSYGAAWITQAKVNLKASTVRFYEGALAQHVVPAYGPLLVSQIRRSHCRDLVLACRAKGLKVATV